MNYDLNTSCVCLYVYTLHIYYAPDSLLSVSDSTVNRKTLYRPQRIHPLMMCQRGKETVLKTKLKNNNKIFIIIIISMHFSPFTGNKIYQIPCSTLTDLYRNPLG